MPGYAPDNFAIQKYSRLRMATKNKSAPANWGDIVKAMPTMIVL
jgi:hypothetical protein